MARAERSNCQGRHFASPGDVRLCAIGVPGVLAGSGATVMAALHQHEGQVASGEERQLVDGAPGRDVVLLGADTPPVSEGSSTTTTAAN